MLIVKLPLLQIYIITSIMSFYYIYVASLSTSLTMYHALSSCHPSIAFYEDPRSRQYSNSISLHPRQLDNFCPTFFNYSGDRDIHLIRWNHNFALGTMKAHEQEDLPTTFNVWVMSLIKSTFENAIGDCISLFACPKNGLFIARESETARFIGRFPRRNSFYFRVPS